MWLAAVVKGQVTLSNEHSSQKLSVIRLLIYVDGTLTSLSQYRQFGQ